jgi:hypothetical protein
MEAGMVLNERRAVEPNRFAGACRIAAENAVSKTLRAGEKAYVRERDLPALIRVGSLTELTRSPAGTAAIIARLESALRAERNRARSGHWTYDLNRHIALRQALLAEKNAAATPKQ